MFVELGLTSTRPHPLQQASLDIDLKRFQSSTISIQAVRGFLHPKPVRCGAEEIRNSVIDVIAVMQLSTTQLGLSCVFISSVKNSKLAVHGDMSKSSCAREFYCTCVQQKNFMCITIGARVLVESNPASCSVFMLKDS